PLPGAREPTVRRGARAVGAPRAARGGVRRVAACRGRWRGPCLRRRGGARVASRRPRRRRPAALEPGAGGGVPRLPRRPRREPQGPEWEIDSLGALTVVLAAVLERLCTRLVAASLAADALEVRLELASGGHHARAVALAVPMREPKPMLALLALDLEAHPPSAAVTRATISARPVRVPAGQGGLWQPPAPRLRDLVAVLARLAALVGPDD